MGVHIDKEFILSKMKYKTKRILVICFIILIVLFPIAFYCYNFRRYSLSNNPEYWGFFGDYIGGVYSVVLTMALFYISYLLNKQEIGYRKLSNAVKEIYDLIPSTNSRKIDIKKINKLNRLIDVYENVLPKNIYEDLINISNYYREIENDPSKRDKHREEDIKDALKRLI